jgi:hypothetical protein
MVRLELIDGAGHVTWINTKSACLDLRVLTQLVAKLPYLQEFRCISCNRCNETLPPEARMLPQDLHEVALPSMTSLDLSQTNVTGTLPTWKNWTTIEVGSGLYTRMPCKLCHTLPGQRTTPCIPCCTCHQCLPPAVRLHAPCLC